MTEETVANAIQQTKQNSGIKGISIASFLQMLEQEKQTCSVYVQSNNRIGTLYFDDGNLIDATQNNLNGIEAAYAIVSWEDCSIALDTTDNRPRKIKHPLGHILLNAAKQQDDLTDQMATKPSISYLSQDAQTNKDLQNKINILSGLAGIRYFYILNKTGNLVAYSAPSGELGELLIYCIITSSNLRKTLNVQSPRRIQMQMKDGQSLLIIPKAGIIFALILEGHSDTEDIANRISIDLSTK